jgi:hypothetical protein
MDGYTNSLSAKSRIIRFQSVRDVRIFVVWITFPCSWRCQNTASKSVTLWPHYTRHLNQNVKCLWHTDNIRGYFCRRTLLWRHSTDQNRVSRYSVPRQRVRAIHYMDFKTVLGIVRAMGDLRYSQRRCRKFPSSLMTPCTMVHLWRPWIWKQRTPLKQWHLLTYLYSKYRVFCAEVKWPCSATVKERMELYLYSPLGLHDLLQG